jgi:pimeloyl-ACP methyl ester carboxylesterase
VLKRLRRLVHPVGTLLGVTGAAAALNRGLRAASAMPMNHLGGTRRPWRWRGFDLFATEQGSGSPLLLVHAVHVGASSFEFRKIVPLLARDHRVVAFDLLGCGLSQMPTADYSAELFVEQILDALEAAGEPAVLVGSALGAAFAVRAAARSPKRVAALVAIAPSGLGTALDGPPNLARRTAGAVLRSPLAGETVYNGMAASASIRSFLRSQLYAEPAAVTPELIAHCYAVAHQPGARYVEAALVAGALDCDVARDLPFVEAPVLVLWGDHAYAANPVANASEYSRIAKRATVVTFPRSGSRPHEEEPEATADAIARFTSAREVAP